MSQFERLDAIAIRVAKGEQDAAGALSTGEALYVALAANSTALLDSVGYTIPEAIARLGQDWTNALVTNWQYKGNPKNFAD